MHVEIFPEHLVELEQLLNGIAMMKELTKRTQDYLVSFGECMSTRIFAAYLNKLGVKARQVRVLLIAYLNLIHAVTKRLFCFFLLII
jgi:aspartate kinase